jgi:hypothetical protein
MTSKKAVGIAISPRPDADGGVADVLYVLFDDGEVRQIWHDGEEWRWSTTGPSSSCRDEQCSRRPWRDDRIIALDRRRRNHGDRDRGRRAQGCSIFRRGRRP